MTTTSALLTGIPGVRECVVCDVDGHVPAAGDAKNSQEMRVAVGSNVAHHLSTVSELLGLGSLEILSITGTEPAWVIAFRLQSLAVAEVESDYSVRKVEQAFKETNWLAATEWVLSDSDIEYLPSPQTKPKENSDGPGSGQGKSPAPSDRLT